MKRHGFHECGTEFGYMVQVGDDRRPCVVEVSAGGSLRLIAATTRLPGFLRELWQRRKHGLRDDFGRWQVEVWYERSEASAHREKVRRIEEALRWGVSTLRNGEKVEVMRGHAAYLLRCERERRAARRAS